jgi:hypothetical protein
VAARPSGVSVICHSSVSPALSPRKTAMPSGMVALSDFDLGQAIDVFDLRLMPFLCVRRNARSLMANLFG